MPALYIGTTADTFTDGVVQQRQLHAAMRGRPNELLELAGVAHGTELLTLTASDGTPPRILAFIRARLQ